MARFEGLPPIKDMMNRPSEAYKKDIDRGLRAAASSPEYQALVASNSKARAKIQSQVDKINKDEKQAADDRAKQGPGQRPDITPMSYSPYNYPDSPEGRDIRTPSDTGANFDKMFSQGRQEARDKLTSGQSAGASRTPDKTDNIYGGPSGGSSNIYAPPAAQSQPSTSSSSSSSDGSSQGGLRQVQQNQNSFMNYMYSDPDFARAMGNTLSYMPQESHPAVNNFLLKFQDIYNDTISQQAQQSQQGRLPAAASENTQVPETGMPNGQEQQAPNNDPAAAAAASAQPAAAADPAAVAPQADPASAGPINPEVAMDPKLEGYNNYTA